MIRVRRGRRGAAQQGAQNPQNSDEQNDLDDLKAVPMQWRRMVGYLGPYKLRLLVALVSLTLGAALSLVFPYVMGEVVDSALTGGGLAALDSITVGLIAVFFVRAVATLIESFNLNFVGERILADLRKQVFSHLQTLSLGFFAQRRVGELVSRISSDVTTMRSVLTNNLSTLLQQTLIMIGSIALMIVFNWRLTLFIVALIPVIMLVGFVFGMYVQRYSTRVQDELADSTVITEEVLQGIREVKSFVREPHEIARYDNAIERAFRAAVRLAQYNAVFGSLMAFIGFGSLAGFLWFGGREVLAGRLSGGELITFLVYGVSVAGSFASLVGLYTQFQQAIGATKRVFQLLDTYPDVMDAPDAAPLPRIAGRITFEDVSFSYDDKSEVLHNINLDIAPGEIIALVGPSGAGKSTTFNLIPRFYDPTAGRLLIDGIDARTVRQASLREQVGIVPQETLLFGGTIRENILYGRLTATEDELFAAARAANAHDFIMELPDQYETTVGDRGVRLSGGQRQRVAIARAILKDPRILLLDEATSSLDNESEVAVQEALGRLMQDRTTVIIAHRLSTVRVAHRIAVLDKGQIIELGTHDELMARPGGLYARLYEMQFREEDAELLQAARVHASEPLLAGESG